MINKYDIVSGSNYHGTEEYINPYGEWIKSEDTNAIIADGIMQMLQYYADGANTKYCTIDRLID